MDQNQNFKDMIDKRDIDLLVCTRQAENVNRIHNENCSFGDKIADKVAAFNGSWTFILFFSGFIIIWMIINTILVLFGEFDPYPFVLLNLVLGCITAIQSPIIMMSQNRQSEKDSILAEQDYKLNLKSEIILEDIIKRLKELEQNQEVIIGNQIKIFNSISKSTQLKDEETTK